MLTRQDPRTPFLFFSPSIFLVKGATGHGGAGARGGARGGVRGGSDRRCPTRCSSCSSCSRNLF